MVLDKDCSSSDLRTFLRNWWRDIEIFGFKVSGATAIASNDSSVNPDENDFAVTDPTRDSKGRSSDDVQVICTVRRGARHGACIISGKALEEHGIEQIAGKYVSGILKGKAKVILLNGLTLEGHFDDGRLEGPVKGCLKDGGLALVGFFSKGRACGPFWRRVEGGGFLYGSLDHKARFCGPGNAFVFPDFDVALVGHFTDDGVLSAAWAMDVSGAHICNEIVQLSFSAVHSYPEPMSFSPSTISEIRCQPLVQDPHEQRTVYVAPSLIPGAGEGLFAANDVPEGYTMAFYNGIRVRPGETPPFRSKVYEIYVDWCHTRDRQDSDYMDLPLEYGDTKKYNATLGHKINHSFKPNCRWDVINHPVFGRIPRIVSLRTIPCGEELTCHYMIDMEDAGSSGHLSWYLKQWEDSSTN